MRVAITGSRGLIGTALIASLEADGHSVLRVVRGGGGGPGTTSWDIEAGEIDPAAFEGVDAVVHLSGEGIGEKRWTDEQKKRIYDSRIDSTSLLARTLAGLSQKPKVLVTASGVDAYGDGGDAQLTEDSPRGSTWLAELVRDWEGAAQPAADAGIRVAHIRTSMVLAAKGGALERMVKIAKLGVLGKIGSGKQWMSWITLDDEVRAIRHIIDGDLSGPVNLAAPNPVTNAEFTKLLGKAVKRPTFIPVPAFGPKLLLGSELAETLLLESKRAVPKKLLDDGFQFRHPTLPEAFAALL